MSVFDHVYYPFHHDHINTPVNTPPLITPFELQMVGVSHENWGFITSLGVLINHCIYSQRSYLFSVYQKNYSLCGLTRE